MTRNPAGYITVISLSVLLAACGGSVPAAPSTGGQRSVLPSTTPVQAYSMVARQMKGCWFNPADPILTKHIFRAEAGAGGASGSDTKIVVYDRADDGRLGLKAYTVAFEPRSKGTVVTTQNLRLPSALGQKLTADIGYWVQGGATCDGPASASPSPRGSFRGPPSRATSQ